MGKIKFLLILLSAFLLAGVMCDSGGGGGSESNNSAKARIINDTDCTLTNVRYGNTNWGTINANSTSSYKSISGYYEMLFTADGDCSAGYPLVTPQAGKTYYGYVYQDSLGSDCSCDNIIVDGGVE